MKEGKICGSFIGGLLVYCRTDSNISRQPSITNKEAKSYPLLNIE